MPPGLVRVFTLGCKTVHHALHNIDFVLYGVVDEVGVNQDVIGRTELGIEFEEQRRGDLCPIW